jgi:hypothetical protein
MKRRNKEENITIIFYFEEFGGEIHKLFSILRNLEESS